MPDGVRAAVGSVETSFFSPSLRQLIRLEKSSRFRTCVLAKLLTDCSRFANPESPAEHSCFHECEPICLPYI